MPKTNLLLRPKAVVSNYAQGSLARAVDRSLLMKVSLNRGHNPESILRLIDALKERERIALSRRTQFSGLRTGLSAQALSFAILHHVSAGPEDADLHPFILEKEFVHKPKGEIEEMCKLRFGDANQNKDCQALVIPHASGRRLVGQILRYKFATVVDERGRVYLDRVPGDVDRVIESEILELTGKENGIGYYSISADFNVKAAGERLKAELVRANPRKHFETTISPIRELFDPEIGGYKRTLLDKPDDEIRQIVLAFIQERKDMPSKSHLGSGAFVGWIHINRDSIKDPIIVNYVYDRALLDFHRNNYRQGALPMSEALMHVNAQANVSALVISPSKRVSPRPQLLAA